jgi:hypothetical protein
MSLPQPRRVRPTIRCLADLGVDAGTPFNTRLGALDHPVIEKARGLAPSYPENQVRIQAIEDTMVFRFTHGRTRVLTWLEEEVDIVWLLAADMRRENEGYDLFVGAHARGELLPGEADARRLEDEAILDLAHAIRDGAPEWVEQARLHPNEERRFLLPGGAAVRLFYSPGDGVDTVWAAIPTLLANELGLPDRVRGLVVAAITEALGGAGVDFEQRHDWPTGPLQNFEVAYFWLQ